MTSNEYNVLKRKINNLEDWCKEIKQDIKDIKMAIERVSNGHKSTTDVLPNLLISEIEYIRSLPQDEDKEIATKILLQKYGLIDDDGNMKLTITKSSKEANKERTELDVTIEKAKVCPECGHKNRCPNTYTEKPDLGSMERVHGIMTNTKVNYVMKNKFRPDIKFLIMKYSQILRRKQEEYEKIQENSRKYEY